MKALSLDRFILPRSVRVERCGFWVRKWCTAHLIASVTSSGAEPLATPMASAATAVPHTTALAMLGVMSPAAKGRYGLFT